MNHSASLDITMSLGDFDPTMSLGDKEEIESFESSKEPNLLPSLSGSSGKQTDHLKLMNLPSNINLDQSDTIDNSNCATSPSKQTYLSSIPGTIYYNGLDSVTHQPHIQNARKVSELDSASQLFVDNPPLQKIRPTPHQQNSESSSVPRMQWTPPQPLTGNSNSHQVKSSRPQYVAQPYNSSAVNNHAVPAIPVEELSMDGFTDTFIKHGVEKLGCGKCKGYKVLLILTAVIIVLAISAVIFSIVYVTGSKQVDTNETEKPERCRYDCYNPLRPGLICRCECYTKEDDKYYTCSSKVEYYYPHNDDDGSEIGNQIDNIVDDEIGNQIDNVDNNDDTGGNFVKTDDDVSLVYSVNDDTFTDDDDADDFQIAYDDSVGQFPCSNLCYRKRIHRDWDPSTCNPSCYNQDTSQFSSRNELWLQWFVNDDDDADNYDDAESSTQLSTIEPQNSNIFGPGGAPGAPSGATTAPGK